MKKLLAAGTVAVLSLLLLPKKVLAPIIQMNAGVYPGSDIPALPGDLLFSPIGKKESRYIGHVGIVTRNQDVIHSIPAGLVRDSIGEYFRKFRNITLYSPINPDSGENACEYLELLYSKHPRAKYRIMTPLGSREHEQYCTKTVWQAYYFGAKINIRKLPANAKAVHPQRLKDRRVFHFKKKFS